MTNELYDEYEFHDNWIHGISYAIVNTWDTQISLDIDYIMKWPDCTTNDAHTFLISKAFLIFRKTSNLFIDINQTGKGFLLNPGFNCISSIKSEKIITCLENSSHSRFDIINYEGKKIISMNASEMKLKLIGQPITTSVQHLTYEQRNA